MHCLPSFLHTAHCTLPVLPPYMHISYKDMIVLNAVMQCSSENYFIAAHYQFYYQKAVGFNNTHMHTRTHTHTHSRARAVSWAPTRDTVYSVPGTKPSYQLQVDTLQACLVPGSKSKERGRRGTLSAGQSPYCWNEFCKEVTELETNKAHKWVETLIIQGECVG